MESTPYWIRTASLPGFPALDSDLDVNVVVIGAGLTGVTAAYLLKQAGVKVALLERDRCASADTGHTTAHLTYVTDARLHHLAKKFGRDCARSFWEAGAQGIDQIHELVRAENIECDFKWVPGYLHGAFKDPASNERELLERDAELARELGFDAEFIEAVPYAGRPGVRFSHQAKFHPRKYLAALVARIPGNGSHVFEQSEVSAVEEEPLTAKVGEHRIRCDYVIIATHCPIMGKTNLVSATLFQSKLALYTSYVLGARIPAGSVPEALYWDTGDPYYYLRVDRPGDEDYAIFGGEDCKTGQESDSRGVFNQLQAVLSKVLPTATVQDRWLGQVVETNDGLPFIGESSGNQFVATGFCGNGFTLGTLSAMMARDRYLGKKNPWFDLFDVGRKKLLGGTWRYVTENADYPYYMLRDRFAKAEATSTDAVEAGEGKILNLDGKRVAAYRATDGQLTLLSPVCTHLKCIVRWNAADSTWDCPCHGSRFRANGEVLSGPAEQPLHLDPML
jgi:glycine/D-amino acid oxidase-like deaminating enzyme/nitrite reductase/ring-hydroxylating ferredoxin subunit